MDNYSQELKVNFETMVVNSDGTIQVTLFIRGTKKNLTTKDQELKDVTFEPGEKVRLLYTDPTNWTIKKYLDALPIDKCFRKD